MRVCSLSVDQALGIWSELWRAYIDNVIGGQIPPRTVPIPTYRLHGHAPLLSLQCGTDGQTPPLRVEEERRVGLEAKGNLLLLLRAFRAETECAIDVDGVPLSEYWGDHSFHHYCHVRVRRKEPGDG